MVDQLVRQGRADGAALGRILNPPCYRTRSHPFNRFATGRVERARFDGRFVAASRTIDPDAATMVRQFLVYDALDTCPYLPDRLARFPLRLSERKLRREELDAALAEGDRRQGVFLYRPSCPDCTACEAIRIAVDDFTLSPSLRRVLARGDARLTMRVGPAVADEERAALYARHKWGRGLAGAGRGAGRGRRRLSGVSRRHLLRHRRVRLPLQAAAGGGGGRRPRPRRAVGGLLRLRPRFRATSASAPTASSSSSKPAGPGACSYLYLGLFVADCRHLTYKARFLPHERLVDGVWRRFDRE